MVNLVIVLNVCQTIYCLYNAYKTLHILFKKKKKDITISAQLAITIEGGKGSKKSESMTTKSECES